MPNSYELHDANFVQYYASESAADALYWTLGPVPTGRVWTLRACSYNPNIVETLTICFSIIPRGSSDYVMISVPRNIALSTTLRLPIFAEGMELVLHQGEQLRITRDAATAGSTMLVKALYIDTDLPFYRELDKHKELRALRRAPMMDIFRKAAQASGGGAPTGRGGPTGGRGAGSGTPI